MKTKLKHTLTASLLAGASLTALAGQARASEVIFGAENVGEQSLDAGQPVVLAAGVTQLRLDGGAIVSFVGAAEFALAGASAIELRKGSVTVTSPSGDPVVVRMPGGVEGRLSGVGGAASFTAGADGASGHVMSGEATIAGRGGNGSFRGGQFWRAGEGDGPSRVVANGAAVPTPVLAAGQPSTLAGNGTASTAETSVPDLGAGPAAVAEAGFPMALGEALAANGASGDVVAAARAVEASVANASLATFPVGDYGTLVAYAARLSAPHGGQAFPGAGADIVRTYLQYLAGGGARESFVQAYSGLLLQYLDLIRAGALPSSFTGASVQQIDDFLAWQARTSGFGALSARNRALVEAYRDFLAAGGDADRFAATYTDLASAFFAYLRAGGSPAQFTGASQATVNAYLAFLRDADLSGQLSAANRALLDAYLAGLANGGNGLAFADQYRAALGDYFGYLAAGNLPSGYSATSAAALRQYLDTLDQTGLLDAVLGAQAEFYRRYLDHLRTGGAPDAWSGLPANVFAGYADALAGFDAWLKGGNLPSAYGQLPVATLKAYLDALAAAGALDRFLGANASFFGDYLAHLAAGGAPDAWAGLPANIFAGYANALDAYATWLAAGNLPSAYGAVPIETLRAYLEALRASGAFDRFLAGQAAFLHAYLAHLQGGGTADGWASLPANIFNGYGAALTAYFDYLRNGGLPSAYAGLSQADIATYLEALHAAGALDRFLGTSAAFYLGYRAYLAGGGNPDSYPDLPVPPDFNAYAAAVGAFAAYLRAGGLPAAYGDLDAATLQRYLVSLRGAGLLDDALLAAYLDHIAGGGAPGGFAGAPIYVGYAADLQAYYDHLLAGGLPSAYAALTAAQIRERLQALSGVGVLDDLLVAQHAFLSAYLAHLEAGRSPDLFPSLPVFDTYRTAVLGFLDFVSNGGLPSAYGAHTAVDLIAWFAALRDAGLLDATLAGAPGAGAYVTHLLGGGAPDAFAGLPVLETYKASVQAYFDYIAAGDKPSLYGEHSQAELATYIRKLEAAGILAASYAAADRQMLLDYAAWIEGGNDPDAFPGLPQAPLVALPAPAYTYSGGFTPTATSTYKAITPTAAGQRLFTSQNNGVQLVSNAQGQVTRLAPLIGTAGAQVKDAAGNSAVVVGRWTGGAYTVGSSTFTPTGAQSLHYYAASQASFTAPAAGRIDYTILAATQPTYESGYGAEGLFDASFAIDFLTRKAGIQGTIRMPEQGGPVTYSFATPGGTATPNEQLVLTDLAQIGFNAPMTGSGRGCSGSCSLAFNGGFGGTSAENIGFVYNSLGAGVADPVLGAVAFHGSYTAPQNPLPAPNYAYAPGLPGTGLRHLVTGVTITGSSNGQLLGQERNGPATFGPDGSVLSITIDPTQPAGTVFERDLAQSVEVAGNARLVVGRWTDGRYRPFGNGSFPTTLTANQGLHYVLGLKPDFITPYAGRVDYTLLAATRPTYVGGGTMPGLFDATMSIAFASLPKVGITGSIRMPEAAGVVTYAFATVGGSSNPQTNLTGNSDGYISFGAPITGAGEACGTSCSIRFTGSFTGSDPLAIGLTYTTSQQLFDPGRVIQGAAIFTGSWVGTPQTVTRIADRQLFTYTASNAALNPQDGSYDVNGAGQVIGLTSFNGLYDRLGTASVAESGSLAGNLVGWSRWTNGTLDITRFGPSFVALGANESYQILHGEKLTNMPASGTATYTIGGGTRTADNFGAVPAGGSTTGTAKVAFGTSVKLGFDITTSFDGSSYNLWTTGRTADVSTSEITVGVDGKFNAIGPGSNVTGAGCAGDACRPIWNGFLAGDGATAIGLHFRVQNTVQRNLDFHGVAAFTRDAAAPQPAAPQAAISAQAPAWSAWATAPAGATPGIDSASALPPMPGAAPAAGAPTADMLREQANDYFKGRIRF